MRGNPEFVDPESTLREAAQVIVAQGVGVAIVLGPKGPASIVSERDIVSALANQADPDTIWVADVASIDLVAIEDTTSIVEAIKCMASEHIGSIPVKRNGEVVGLVVVGDILELLATTTVSVGTT